MRGHPTNGKARLAATVLGLAAVASLAGCAIGFRGPAPDVSDSTAFIQGDVLSNRTESGEYWFKYGTSASYGQETAHSSVDFVAGVRQGVFANLSGLDHHTTYHYALCADDQEPGVGAFCSGDRRSPPAATRPGVAAVLGEQPVRHGRVQWRRDRVPRRGPTRNGVHKRAGGRQPGDLSAHHGTSSFTVGVQLAGSADHSFIFVNLPPSVLGSAGGEDVGARPPTNCPVEPLPGTTLYPAGADAGFEIVDEG